MIVVSYIAFRIPFTKKYGNVALSNTELRLASFEVAMVSEIEA